MPKKTEKLGVPKKSEPLRLKEIRIKNYKGIDSLVVEFPQKRFEDDSDVVVIGSQNGLGKTSILECCSLLLYALSSGDFSNIRFLQRRLRLRLPFERDFAVTACTLFNGKESNHSLSFKKGEFDVSDINNKMFKKEQLPENTEDKYSSDSDIERLRNDIGSILGHDPNPILGTVFLHFNSYRKIQETTPEFGMLVGHKRGVFLPPRYAISSFKIELLKLVMFGNPTYFDVADTKGSENALEFLNYLLKRYADVTFKKPEPKSDNTLEIILKHQSTGQEFLIDGLSSGQKEIISTLFLIWLRTQSDPKIVLIDEPELHLNRDWQQTFIRDLVQIAPQNQYVLATHSVEIANSVDSYQRILLQ